jgi:hypothetical protein
MPEGLPHDMPLASRVGRSVRALERAVSGSAWSTRFAESLDLLVVIVTRLFLVAVVIVCGYTLLWFDLMYPVWIGITDARGLGELKLLITLLVVTLDAVALAMTVLKALFDIYGAARRGPGRPPQAGQQ